MVIVTPEFRHLADVLINATQNHGTDPAEIEDAVERVEGIVLALQAKLDSVSHEVGELENQLGVLNNRLG